MWKAMVVATAWLLGALPAQAQEQNWQLVRQKTEARLQEIVAGTRGALGLAAVDLTSGERFGVNEDFLFPQGSAIKIPILLEVYKQAAEGKLKLTDSLRVSQQSQVGGSGVLQYLGDNTSQLSVRDLCVLMIVLSDNTATNLLIELVGRENVNQTLASLGFAHTRLQRKMMDEAARLMEMLYKGEVLTRAACDDLLSILQIPKEGELKAGLPDTVPVAFKPGSIPGVRTEWAIVYLKERPYVVVVMENYGLAEEAAAAMKEISRTLYDYFWRRGNATRYGTYVDPALIH